MPAINHNVDNVITYLESGDTRCLNNYRVLAVAARNPNQI